MKLWQTRELPLGLYRVYWKEEHGGGSSLAAVGQKYSGARWLACVNWTCGADRQSPGTSKAGEWEKVNYMERIYAPPQWPPTPTSDFASDTRPPG